MKRAMIVVALVAFAGSAAGQEKKSEPLTPQQLWDLVPKELREPGESVVRRDRLDDWLAKNLVGKFVVLKSERVFVAKDKDNGGYIVQAEVDSITPKGAPEIAILNRSADFVARGFSDKEAEAIEDAKAANVAGRIVLVTSRETKLSNITINGKPAGQK